MKNYLVLLALSVILFGCGHNSQLESSFQKILHESESLDSEGIKSLITQKSMDYIEGLAKLPDTLNYDLAERFGLKHDIPLETMRLHAQSLQITSDGEDEAERLARRIDNIILVMKVTGTGILASDAKERIKFHDSAVNGNTATVMAAVNTGVDKNTNILSSYLFKKEQGEWKIDIRSTMTLQEKILKQMVQRGSRSAKEIIAYYVANNPKTMQFQYQYAK